MVFSKIKSLHLESIFIFPTFCPDFIITSKKHLQRIETAGAVSWGAPKKKGTRGNCLIRLTQYPPPAISMSAKRWSFHKAKWSHYIALSNKFKRRCDCLIHLMWMRRTRTFVTSSAKRSKNFSKWSSKQLALRKKNYLRTSHCRGDL